MQQLCHSEDSLKIRITYKSGIQGGLWHNKEDLFMPLPRLLVCLYLQFIHQAVLITKVGQDASFSSILVYNQPIELLWVYCCFLLTFPIAPFIFIKLLFSCLFTLIFFSFLFFHMLFFICFLSQHSHL